MQHMIFKLIIIVLLAPVLLIVLVAGCGRAFLYHPTDLSASQLRVLASRPGWRAESLDVAGGLRLTGLVRPAAEPHSLWLLFFGGNAVGLPSSQDVLELLNGEQGLGLAVWAYRGYDGSGGRPIEKALCQDARTQIVHLKKTHGVRPAQVILVGQSLGSGIAAKLAADLTRDGEPPAGLVLLSPYTSIAAVFDDYVPLIPVGWAVADPYRTDRIIDDLPGPVLIVHGRDDTLIKIKHGRVLAQALGERAHMVELPGRGHNDLLQDLGAVMAIRRFVAACGRSSRD